MFGAKNPSIERLTSEIQELAEKVGELRGERSLLSYQGELDSIRRQKGELELELERLREDAGRQTREIEHKLGLHRTQIESERVVMQKEAEAERIRAVEEAKLAVREGNLDAERKRFEEEIEFRTKRFEEEAATLRNLTSQILERLPTVNVERRIETVEHVGQRPAPALEAGS
jgi:hypothetical protein